MTYELWPNKKLRQFVNDILLLNLERHFFFLPNPGEWQRKTPRSTHQCVIAFKLYLFTKIHVPLHLFPFAFLCSTNLYFDLLPFMTFYSQHPWNLSSIWKRNDVANMMLASSCVNANSGKEKYLYFLICYGNCTVPINFPF